MASACIKMSPDSFPTSPKYSWLSPRVSFSRDDVVANNTKQETQNPPNNKNADLETTDFLDFEFRLNDPTKMLTADQLFSNGKLVPTQKPMTSHNDVIPPETPKLGHKNEFSPKAPKCSSRWKELLGLKKQSSNDEQKGVTRTFKNLLQRNNTKASVDSLSMRLPLLNEFESDSVTVSARLSLSSSSCSSSHEHEDLPRLSLDLDKPSTSSNSNSASNSTIPPRNGRVRTMRHRSSLSSDNSSVARGVQLRGSVRKGAVDGSVVGLTVDSPRMNSSGKIVFQSLERSSSSPSSFNGGQRYRHRGMERSYSANVRVTPVLNVPVCSLRGFPLFSSQVKKENGGGGGSKSEKNSSKR